MEDNVKESELSAPEEIKSFRADEASGNYLSMDKPDVQFSAKKISRAMSKPTRKDQRKIVRMAKLLKDPEIQVRDVGHVRRLRLGRLQIQQEEDVRWSCLHQHWGRQALEFHTEAWAPVGASHTVTPRPL